MRVISESTTFVSRFCSRIPSKANHGEGPALNVEIRTASFIRFAGTHSAGSASRDIRPNPSATTYGGVHIMVMDSAGGL